MSSPGQLLGGPDIHTYELFRFFSFFFPSYSAARDSQVPAHLRGPRWYVLYVYDDVTYVYDDVTYVYDDVTYVYDDVTYIHGMSSVGEPNMNSYSQTYL